MIQVNITTVDGEPITNGILADATEADAYVERMSAHWPADFKREDADYADPQAKVQAQAYLDSTDWYIVRQMDIGTAVPPDVKAKREAARLTVNPPA